MQELEQRLLEAEQRAENAETQVTGRGGTGGSVEGNDCWPFQTLPMDTHGHTHHTDKLLTGTRKTSSHFLVLNKLRCVELSMGIKGSLGKGQCTEQVCGLV